MKRDGRDLAADEHGIATSEYVMILVLVALSCVIVWFYYGDEILTLMNIGTSNTGRSPHVFGP